MKKLILALHLIISTLLIQAQSYTIDFTASGASTQIDSVELYNLNQNTSLFVGGSDTVLLVNGTVGIHSEISNKEALMLYPNPMNHSCRIEFYNTYSGTVQIQVYNMQGQNLLQKNDILTKGVHAYTLKGLKTGVYFIQIITGIQTYTGRLVSVCDEPSHPILSHLGAPMTSETSLESYTPKSTKSTVFQMWYAQGDRLLLIGRSGIYSRAIAQVFTHNESVNFEFIPCTDADNNHYTVVTIGQHTWMYENLATTSYINGSPLNNDTGGLNWSAASNGSYVWYNNNIAYKNIYGALYNWYAARGDSLCPQGWYIPDTLEWAELINYAGGFQSAGGVLKQTGTTLWAAPNNGATNTYGFSALPSGYRDSASVYTDITQTGNWWAKDTLDSLNAWMYAITTLNTEVAKNTSSINSGYAIRCIHNCKNPFVDAGDDVTICEDAESFTPEAEAYNYGSLQWTSNGDGSFSNSNELICVYHLGTNDKLTGHVVLTLTGQPINTCAVSVSDTLAITLTPHPEISVVSGEYYCEGDTVNLNAIVSQCSDIEWICVNGNGIIEDDTQLNTRYIPSPLDWVKGYTDFIIRAYALSPCTDILEAYVRVNYIQLPSVFAGPDQLDIQATATNMLGSQPPQFCLGQWFLDGVGGILNNTSDSASGFTGLENTTYQLVWTITDTIGCKNRDTVLIKFLQAPSPTTPCEGVTTINDANNNTYNTVEIGNQCWMKENLNYASSGSWCYDDNATNCDNYGRLYTWDAAMNGAGSSNSNPSGVQGVCPNGWHIPSDVEWEQLAIYVNSQPGNGNQLKSCRQENSPLGGNCNTTTHPRWDYHPTEYGTDDYGFSALPGGYLYDAIYYSNLGWKGFWWSSTESSTTNAWYYSLIHSNSAIFRGNYDKTNRLSVRCLKNSSIGLPKITTAQVKPLAYDIVVSGGIISKDGGQSITARGIVWSILPEATIDINDGITTNGTDTGAFKSYATNLQANTTYYLRAYATNSNGTAYGEDIIFTTDSVKTVPTVEYHSVNSITSSTAISGGTVSDDGGSPVDARGLLWSTTANVSMTNNTGMVLSGTGTGVFQALVSGLMPETSYYLRAFAKNSEGIGYATEMVFTTPETGYGEPCMGQNTFTDPRDGKTYNIVQIGTNCWMAENLKYLPEVHSFYDNSYYDVRYYVNAYYGTDSIQAVALPNYQNYGVLYNHLAALAACPPGWTLPLKLEWEALANSLSGGINTGGNQLKSCRSENTSLGGGCLTANHPRWDGTLHPHNLQGTDDYGFAALPGGYIIGHTTHGTVNVSVGRRAQWWSATSNGMDATTFEVGAHHSNYQMYQSKQWNGLSVRCVKN